MSQSKAAIAAVAGIVVGVIIAIVTGLGGAGGRDLFGDTTSDITLRVVNGQCVVGKETVVSVKKGNAVRWRVKNDCTGPQTVTVGNFRTQNSSSATNCERATIEIAWPFRDDDEALDKRQVAVEDGESKSIKLRDAKNATSTPVSYYFDVCLGNAKVDPRLVIDP